MLQFLGLLEEKNFYAYAFFFSQGSKTALQFLLLNGAKINTRDKAGKTALLLATELGILNFL